MESTDEENFSLESWTTGVCNPELNQLFGLTENEECITNNETNLLLDSRCTDHIINSDTYLFNCVDLKIPVDVKLPNGKMLKATKVDNVKICKEIIIIKNI